jgi:5-methylcytosine-specific restriction endonuclease McrA
MRAEGGRCHICGLPIQPGLHKNHPGAMQVDHVHALTRGGDPFDPSNLRVAHRRCNLQKGNGRQKPRTQGDRSASW